MDRLLNSKVFGEGEPLVILHGLFGMLDNWQGLAKKFSQHFQVHILDQRNHGKSFHSLEHNYKVMSDDLMYYLDLHGLSKVNLIGHSMGGKTAMMFAALFSERVDKLIVVDIAPRYYAPHHQDILNGLHAVSNSNLVSRKQADEILSEYFDAIEIRQFLLKNLHWNIDNQLVFRFNLKVLSSQINNVGEGLMSNLVFEGDVLFVDGENSDYINPQDLKLIKEHFPNSSVVGIANAGHWVHAEKPSVFFNEVLQFLNK